MATVFPCDQAIVVGGGLAGMSAANTVLENGGRVVLLDKSSFCGGNSTKATSGINGANTRTQRDQGIKDSTELFTNDTMKGGAKKPEIVKVLCENSGADVEWLMDKFNLDLSLVARLGGHSAPRTHRGKERFPGMTITYALIQMVEKVAEKSDKARIITKAEVKKLLTNSSGACVGCIYGKGGADFQEHGPVILCSGGFGADFTSNSLLAQYRPDLMHLPTTNGEHCTGDGIKMGEAIGGKSIDLEWVQVHPTGLVKPDDPDAKIKFLAAEALRGVGGIVLDANGKRFCNELGRRDYVTGEMWKSKPPFRLCLNKAASDEINWHCKHYTGRGVMKFYESGAALAKDMGIDVQVLVDTHNQHYDAAKKTEKDPDGGSWPAYPSGKSWDEASGKTGSGKKFYHNIIPGDKVAAEPFYVAIITPVIHYCMGGLEIDEDSAVVDAKGKAIPGLYAAGEVAGGVHGNNRLGGNSLLDCVVFGRVSGRAAAKYILGGDVKPTSLQDLSGGGLSGEVKASKFSGGAYEDNMNPGAAKAGGAAPGAVGGGYSMADVAKHNTKQDCWVVLSGKVLNVTSFLSEHPGGELAILTFAGKDATEEFDMIHPPDVIEKYAPDAVIGMIGGGAAAGGGAAVAAPALPPGMSYYSMADVQKHASKTDCWVVLSGKVLNVTSFLSEHPGGELAILTFAGKDATEEFDMIHPPDVVGKYAPDAVIGMIGAPGAAAAPAAGAVSAAAPARKDKGDKIANHEAWGDDRGHNWRVEAFDDNPGVLLINVKAYFHAAIYLILSMLWEVCATIFSTNNFKISNDRVGLTRSAILLILFIVIHAVGNLHVFMGPDDFNGYGYFYVRLYWTGFGLPANIVEEYILLSVLLHVFVGLKRTWDMKLSMGFKSGALNLAVTGLALLAFMTIHLFQFRFGDTAQFGPYMLRPPPYLINFWGIPQLNLFWTGDESVEAVGVRNIYKLEFQIFKNPLWSILYIGAVLVFMTHACLGWQKAIPVLGIPKGHHKRVSYLGYAIFIFIGSIYISFPLFVSLVTPFEGHEVSIQQQLD
ncbi:succinate dehydrogenaase [Amphidinium carterae]